MHVFHSPIAFLLNGILCIDCISCYLLPLSLAFKLCLGDSLTVVAQLFCKGDTSLASLVTHRTAREGLRQTAGGFTGLAPRWEWAPLPCLGRRAAPAVPAC